jgi:hypothetical protein
VSINPKDIKSKENECFVFLNQSNILCIVASTSSATGYLIRAYPDPNPEPYPELVEGYEECRTVSMVTKNIDGPEEYQKQRK